MKKSNDYIGAWRLPEVTNEMKSNGYTWAYRLPEVTNDTSVDKGHGLMRSRVRENKQCPKRRSNKRKMLVTIRYVCNQFQSHRHNPSSF